MEEHRFRVSYDWNPYDVAEAINDITKKHGITIEFDGEAHDGFDICIVKIHPEIPVGARIIKDGPTWLPPC